MTWPRAEEPSVGSRLLPTFLGIGAPRSGTTWLHHVLRTHPDLFLPERKELHFFDRHFSSGLSWYRGFFPRPEDAIRYRALGEITPAYLHLPEACERIAATLPECRLIAILRNPADRAFSEYTRAIRSFGFRGSFQSYLEGNERVFLRGLYGEQFARYLDHFPRERLLVLIHERVFSRPAEALHPLGAFLDVEPGAFLPGAASDRVNASSMPRFPRLSRASKRTQDFLRRHDLDAWVEWVRRSGVPRFVLQRSHPRRSLPRFEARERAALLERYDPDLRRLESILGEDLSIWKATRTLERRS